MRWDRVCSDSTHTEHICPTTSCGLCGTAKGNVDESLSSVFHRHKMKTKSYWAYWAVNDQGPSESYCSYTDVHTYVNNVTMKDTTKIDENIIKNEGLQVEKNLKRKKRTGSSSPRTVQSPDLVTSVCASSTLSIFDSESISLLEKQNKK